MNNIPALTSPPPYTGNGSLADILNYNAWVKQRAAQQQNDQNAAIAHAAEVANTRASAARQYLSANVAPLQADGQAARLEIGCCKTNRTSCLQLFPTIEGNMNEVQLTPAEEKALRDLNDSESDEPVSIEAMDSLIAKGILYRTSPQGVDLTDSWVNRCVSNASVDAPSGSTSANQRVAGRRLPVKTVFSPPLPPHSGGSIFGRATGRLECFPSILLRLTSLPFHRRCQPA